MKRILVIIISLIALSMIVLADNMGPVFEGGKLTFKTENEVPHLYDPNFYMDQGFLATATVFNSTLPDIFNKILIDIFYNGNCFDSIKNFVVLAGLNVESDATSVIGISISISNQSNIRDISYYYPNISGNSVYDIRTDNPPSILDLPFSTGKTGHSGYLYVASTKALQFDQNDNLAFTFVIIPHNYY
ncbi:hypothetical protein [Athalassotoga saccharophila]|uniref:hypothetical protein n=1 Tax=Athalassotoga saccharophila TaxID=1441386 RepID=UPI00137AA352|nr:hypothetical protein [Athalassotoga saccharophila]BBJ28973.1 hypothetical protein ATHSA_1898 [Athalassotoga saccharophila]